MKYKEFHIMTGNKHLSKAASKHAKALGYEFFAGKKKAEDFLNFYLDGTFQPCKMVRVTNGEMLTLDEFFNLTPEDVHIKPVREEYFFMRSGHSASTFQLTPEEAADVEHLIRKMVKERES